MQFICPAYEEDIPKMAKKRKQDNGNNGNNGASVPSGAAADVHTG
jgi:hypothetical protein